MFHLDRRVRIPALVLGGCLAATTALGATSAAAAPALGSVTFDGTRGLLSVTGTSGADTIAFVRSTIGSVAALGVDLDGNGSAEALVPEALVTRVQLSGGDGDDRLSTEAVRAGVRTLVVGGAGNDHLQGGDASEGLAGGVGNDTVIGGRGDDVALLGAGNDSFRWAPGDGSDRVEGGAGRDTQLFLGSSADENVRIVNVRGRISFTRDVGSITMNLNDVEVFDTDLGTGRDTTTVGNLAATDARLIVNRLGNNPGSQGRVIGYGTRLADTVTVQATTSAQGAAALVRGLPAAINLIGAGIEDQLELRTSSGNDRITSTVPAGALTLTADGGSGDDQLLGGDADETFVGGSGDDVVDGNRGNDSADLGEGDLDLFIWDPGDGSDTVDGAAGTDVLVFRGSAADEKFAVTATGRGQSRFTRNVGNIVMDLKSVEAIDVAAMAGADTLDVADVSGSGLLSVVANLSGVPGSRLSDGAIDTVTIDGTDRPDTVRIAGRAATAVGSGRVLTDGLPVDLQLTRVEPTDRLIVNGRGGVDTFDTRRLVPGTVDLTTVQ